MNGKTRRKRTAPSALDVARIANVSRSTVSRTFTEGASIDPATRSLVLEAARSLGYRPRSAAASMVEEPVVGRTVGLVMANLDNPFYQAVLAGFLGELHQRGLRVMCRAAAALDGTEIEISSMLEQGVDAMIVAASGLRSGAIEACAAAGVPVVLFNRAVEGVDAFSVQTDNVAGARAIAELLVLGGHKRIAFINGLEGASTNRDRLAGLTQRLEELGLERPIQEWGEYTFEGGREAAKRLMMQTEPPDAIFAANDISALGALEGLRRDLSISVPEEVSVVGFDDIPMASWPSFNLTTVRQRRNKMIAAAMAMIDDIMAAKEAEKRTVIVDSRLILRGSARLARSEPDQPS
ncbi:LacI family DNA-binding transcriptional regulator [Amorphus orientalis]|uniref:DNA-binding LacI/PurR family transcriptional regulator n=1 Tax=Amorphus orientalis TaxID=649198 RepID=A0AAE3VSQ4_9HYPH|nr:substrate-binding domain-containing protein [Amorphus orientalis]MDQ0317512.1 DNA-binding LacI/PurR family transcriptional regulator [Amorphus orientalis]